MTQQIPVILDPSNQHNVSALPEGDTLDPTTLGTGGTSDTDVLHKDGTWGPEGGVGNGNVVGPSGSTTHALPRFADDTGQVLDESAILVDNGGNLTQVGTVNGRVVENDGEALDDHLAASAPHAGHATLAGGKVPDAELPSNIARGPGSTVTDRAVAVFDGTSGALLDESDVLIAPDGSISSPGGLEIGTDLEVDGDVTVGGDIIVAGLVDTVDVAALKATVDAIVAGGGTGDVVGPGTATVDNRITRWHGITGTDIQQSAVTLDDSGNFTGAGTYNGVNIAGLVTQDTTLQANIDAEVAARIADVDTEEAARISADGTEATTRAAADVAEASARATADTSEAIARAAADATLQSNMDALDGANVGTTPADLVAALFRDRTGADFNIRTAKKGALVRPVVDGDSVRFDFDRSIVQPERDLYQTRVFAGSKIAGATLRPNITGDVNPAVQNGAIVHDGERLDPFQNWCETDFYGYPHHLYKQMNGQSTGNTAGQTRGYEAGQKIRKGDMLRRPGRGVRYETRGTLLNVGWQDAIVEHVLEPNPVCSPAGVYNGANRIRFVTDELGFVTPDPLFYTFAVELAVHRAQEYSWEAEMRIYSATGRILRSYPFANYTTSGFNWLTTDAKLQLRWRVDRIANLDTYNDDFQGSNQGSDLLRLDTRRFKYQPIGFEQLRRVA